MKFKDKLFDDKTKKWSLSLKKYIYCGLDNYKSKANMAVRGRPWMMPRHFFDFSTTPSSPCNGLSVT